jgi:hypothetical protein
MCLTLNPRREWAESIDQLCITEYVKEHKTRRAADTGRIIFFISVFFVKDRALKRKEA